MPQGANDELTVREREIARLVAQGLQRREIADRLVISSGTVNRHVHDILQKTGTRDRVALGLWVREHLAPPA
jgi:DNA-binding NarL/FixJ family response regulator